MKYSLKKKLMASYIAVIVVFGIFVYYTAISQIVSLANHDISQRLDSISKLGLEYVDSRYPGEWSIQNGKLYKGDELINGNFQVVDRIKNQTGALITIFQGDTRVSTNVQKSDGTRAIGTKASDQVAEIVLKEGKQYTGEAAVVGKKDLTQYTPIKNQNGEIIGMWFTGVEKTYVDSQITKISLYLLGIILIGMFLTIIASIFIANIVLKPIIKLREAMDKVKEGDLTAKAEIISRDEVAKLCMDFNGTVEMQKEIIVEVMDSSNAVNSTSQEINGATEQLASTTQNEVHVVKEVVQAVGEMDNEIKNMTQNMSELSQDVNSVSVSVEEMSKAVQETANSIEDAASAIHEVTASIEQMDNSIDIIVKHSKQAQFEASSTVSKAKEGNLAVNNTIQEMDKISSEVVNLSAAIKELGISAEKIGEIVNVIDDIADQTNLLSLNAAIEAARAGEVGRGFAVVANSIRSLAESSGEATNDIAKIIKKIQNEVKNAVVITNQSMSRVEEGVQYVKGTGDVFEHIFSAINNTSNLISEISGAIGQQKDGSKEIVTAMEKMSDLINQISAAVGEQAAGSDEVVRAVGRINNVIKQMSETTQGQSLTSTQIVTFINGINLDITQLSASTEEITMSIGKMFVQTQNLTDLISKFKVK